MDRLRNQVFNHSAFTGRDALAGYVVTVLGVAGATAALTPPRDRLGLLNVGLLFLVLVVLIAARWGWGPGLFASVAANLAFNFFFVPPRHTLTVQDPANIIALTVFLLVASLTSFLLARARTGEAAARRREQETVILYDLSRLIGGERDLATTLAGVCDRVRDTFAAESCAVLLPADGALSPVAWSGPRDTGWETGDERQAAARAMAQGALVALGGRPGVRRLRVVGSTGRRRPVTYLPFRASGYANGVLRVAGRLNARVSTADELRLLEAFADEAARSVERDRLLREAARAEALQEADQLKSALLSAVSHDLRTPLTAILASASSLLQTDVAWDEAARRQFLTQIEEQALRLTRLVNNLLDLSRIEGGAVHPDRDWYDVAEMLESVIAGLGTLGGGHPIVLDVAPDAGAALFDHVHLGQVLQNLLENAAKFSPTGAPVRVAARRVDGRVEINVEDQGPGIPDTERGRVFEKFYRVAGTARPARGAGLGLAICKGLVEANGGRIRAEEAPGGGARLVVALPAAPLPAIVEDGHLPHPSHARPGVPGRRGSGG